MVKFVLPLEDCFDTPEIDSQTIIAPVLDNLFDFVGVGRNGCDEFKTDYVKSNPGKLCDLLINYKEVEDLLDKSSWAYLMDDNIGWNMPGVNNAGWWYQK